MKIEMKTNYLECMFEKEENIIEYEVMTRDNRIGEITNVATSIENRYTTNDDIKELYSNVKTDTQKVTKLKELISDYQSTN